MVGEDQRIVNGRLNIMILSGGELGTLVSSSVPTYPSVVDPFKKEDDYTRSTEGSSAPYALFKVIGDEAEDKLRSIINTRLGNRNYSYLCLDSQIGESVQFLTDTVLNKTNTDDLAYAISSARYDKLPALVERLMTDNPIAFARIIQIRHFVENEDNYSDTAKYLQEHGSIGKLFRRHFSFDSFNNIKMKLNCCISMTQRHVMDDLDLISNGMTFGKLAMRDAIDYIGGKSLVSRSSALLDLIDFGDIDSKNVEDFKYQISQYSLEIDEAVNRYLLSKEKYSEKEALRITRNILEGKNFISFFLFTPFFSL
jgi:hypothetical protein